jgi:hypothetical protein
MKPGIQSLLLAAGLSAVTFQAYADIILTVGAGDTFSTVSAAVSDADADANAADTYVIEVAPGTYQNDFPDVTRAMTIEVMPGDAGQQVLLLATEPLPNEEGIIRTTASLTVNGLTFEGAEISAADGGNGAGIRDLNGDKVATFLGNGPPGQPNPPVSLIVENSNFIGNQEGILTGYDTSETIAVSNSNFINNGNPDPAVFQHGLYVNYAGSLTVTNSLFCGQLIGHDIKSRALSTTIENNQIFDGAAGPGACNVGTTSYGIDVPNGGVATISNNQITQGSGTENSTMVDYGSEGLLFADNSLLVSDNNFLNSGEPDAIGVYNNTVVNAQLTGNSFEDVPCPLDQRLVCSDQTAGGGGTNPNQVPEPASLALFAVALVGLGAGRRKRVSAYFARISASS